MKPSLDEILERILMWKVEVESGYNDGWTKRHYRGFLNKIRQAVCEETPKVEIPEDPSLAKDDEFNF